MTRRPRRGRAALAAVACATVAALVAGCSSVPTSGPIEQGPVVDAGESTQFIRVIAAPPSRGARPEEVVRGFLEAGASLEQDHAIARRYLTESASAQWDPGAGTTVYEPTSLEVTRQGDAVLVQAAAIGQLHGDGTLVALDPPEQLSTRVSLALVEEAGAQEPEWRIVDPPPGIMISSSDLRRAYRPYETHFPSARSSVLVPDGRLIPVVGPSLPTALAELVLGGPAEWLAPGVRPISPEGTGLALGAVPVTDGVARVELTDQALSASDPQRRDLAAQLTWTLTQLPEIVAVELLVAGEPFEVGGIPLQMTRDSWRARAPDALSVAQGGPAGPGGPPEFLLEGRTIVRVVEDSRTSIPLPREVPSDLAELAVALDQRRAAAADPAATGLWLLPLAGATEARLVEAGQVGDISFDVDGRAWFLEEGGVRRVDAAGSVETFDVPGDPGDLTALQMARDGARIAVVAGGRVFLGVVQQRESGPAIASLRRVETEIERARDVAWRDAGTLDVLGALAGGAPQVLRVDLASGQVVALGTPARPREVAAAPGALTLVSTGSGGVFTNVGLQWREQGTAQSAAYPG